MRRPRPTLALLPLLLLAPIVPLQGQGACRAGKTALVLAGGGAKGMAHLGVIHILDSLGIRPDFVIGTSMGSIVGALYASGYTAHEIDSLARGLPMTELVTPRAPSPARAYSFYKPLIYWAFQDGKIHLVPGAVPENQLNSALNQILLRGNLQARGDFGRMPIPYYAAASDVSTTLPALLHKGDLPQAVAASMIDYLFSQSADSANPGDVYIESDVTGLGSLDFSVTSVDTAIAHGRVAARAALIPAVGPKCLPLGVRTAPAEPPLVVQELNVPGLSRAELQELLAPMGLAQ